MSRQDYKSFALLIFPPQGLAWNIPGHMLSGAIAYQTLQRENPYTIPTVRSVLKKNPWYEPRWKAQLDKQPESDRNEILFMLAARWADDIRTRDKAESRLPWHDIDFPFKPEGEPASIQFMPLTLFSREYANGDRGGIEMCVRACLNAAPIELHRLWDAVITSSGNIDRLRTIASALLRRFSGSMFRELDHPKPEHGQKKAMRLR